MSKAFTKETDGDSDEDLPEGVSPLPVGTRNYMTPAGADRLRRELSTLLHETRPELVKVVAWAASNGDRSENGDYLYGKKRLREIDRRIRFLQKRLDAAEVVDPSQQKGDRVLFGATVRLQDEDGGERVYSIVGIDETDIPRGRISWISPVGRALLNQKKGDVVTVRMPRGDEEFEILDVRFLPIE
jgi:transcription elongation factor GreB